MMFTGTVFAGFIALLCTRFGFVDARLVQRDVVSPPITYPTAGTVWNVNERHNITWDTSVIPSGTNNTGMLVLGFLDANDPNNEHLDLNNPLAKGFPITAGRADITVPSVTTRDSYILVLFGDSGNSSPKFTINNISIAASSSTVAPSSESLPASASTPDTQPTPSSAGFSTALTSEAISSTFNGGVSGSTANATVSAHVASASTFTASTSATSASTAQGQPAAAQSATSPNVGVRSATYGGAATWISTICSLALVLGFSL